MLQVFVLGIVAMSAGAGATWLIAVSLSESAVASSANAGRFAGLGEEPVQPHRLPGQRREATGIPRRHPRASIANRVREMSFRVAGARSVVRSVQCVRRL